MPTNLGVILTRITEILFYAAIRTADNDYFCGMVEEFIHTAGIGRQALVQAVGKRRSVRTFTGAPLADDDRSMLEKLVSLPLLTGREEAFGTYGVVRNAACFIAVPTGSDATETRRNAARAELIVLWLTSKGYGTCWLGSTFHNVPGPKKLAALIAVGVPAPKAHLLSRLTSALARSTTRAPFAKLFETEQGSAFEAALQLVRLAPSALNRQPWRAVQRGRIVRFYTASADLMGELDMGIALSHFELGAPAGEWMNEADAPGFPKARYIVSYSAK